MNIYNFLSSYLRLDVKARLLMFKTQGFTVLVIINNSAYIDVCT